MTTLTAHPDWSGAPCLSTDPELFFPIGSTGPAAAQIAAAKSVCEACPHVAACLQWALANDVEFGVWGGTSEDERRALQRRNARARRAA